MHWLPIWAMIGFKIATLVHKVRTNHRLSYLADLINEYRPARTLRSSSMTLFADLINEYRPARTLRSSSMTLFEEPPKRTSTGRRHCFRYTVTKTWDNLPETVPSIETLSTFRRQLKNI